MKNKKVLVVAFDGLDKELIEKYDLEHVRQEEYGDIDNKTGMTEIKTSELFASFISGKTHEDHGITGHTNKEYEDEKSEKIITPIKEIVPKEWAYKIPALVSIKDLMEKGLGAEKVAERATKEDLETDTLFEKIEGSRAMYVPGYNPGMLWRTGSEVAAAQHGYSSDRQAQFWDRRGYEVRKKYFFKELENDIVSPRDFLMVHFFRPDQHQHYYGDPELSSYNENKLKKMYMETDNLAKEIKEKALEAGYDTVIFMSDHGLPAKWEHNENAFYSSNTELFGEKIPKITDFHDKIIELTGGKK